MRNMLLLAVFASVATIAVAQTHDDVYETRSVPFDGQDRQDQAVVA